MSKAVELTNFDDECEVCGVNPFVKSDKEGTCLFCYATSLKYVGPPGKDEMWVPRDDMHLAILQCCNLVVCSVIAAITKAGDEKW